MDLTRTEEERLLRDTVRGLGDQRVRPHAAAWDRARALPAELWAELGERTLAQRVAKPLASTGFVLVALAAGATGSPYGQWVLAALVLSWVGDVCLLSSRSGWFLAGLGAFLLGHVAFGAAFWTLGPAPGWVLGSAAGLAGVALGVRHWLGPYVPTGMRRPVDAYMLVISAMVALALGATAAGASPRVALGAVAFYLSDLAVARDRFVSPSASNRLWGLPLYYGAQLVLASTIAA
ncbi:MAG: acyl-CoA dehydrogenase family protein [Myxococcales bacterium]|nr:acyl-CoA dehydrogenase family protein [Myxococcales bacterium]